MTPKRVLRICLACEWLSFIAGTALYFAYRSSLPEPLLGWLDAEAERDPTSLEVVVMLVLLSFFVCGIVGSIGLFLLQKWGAWVYLTASVGGILVLPFSGPEVSDAMTATLSEVASIMTGLVIGIAFFTDALGETLAESRPLVVRAVPARERDS